MRQREECLTCGGTGEDLDAVERAHPDYEPVLAAAIESALAEQDGLSFMTKKSFVEKVKTIAKRAVEIEKTAPPGDVLVGPTNKVTLGEWKRRHPVVGTPPSEHGGDCLCDACDAYAEVKSMRDHDEYLDYLDSREERIRFEDIPVVSHREEEEQDFLTTEFVRGGMIWNRATWADGRVDEQDTGVVATSENARGLTGSPWRICEHPFNHRISWVAGPLWCKLCGAVYTDHVWVFPKGLK